MFKSLINSAVGISRVDLPVGVAVIVIVRGESKGDEKFVPLGRGYQVVFLNNSSVRVAFKDGNGAGLLPLERVQTFLIRFSRPEGVEDIGCSVFVPDLRGSEGGECVMKLTANKERLLKQISLWLKSAEEKQTQEKVDTWSNTVQPQESVDVFQIVSRVRTKVLWRLHLCVMTDQVNPVARFTLPDRACRAEIKGCCYGDTGVQYSRYAQPDCFGAIAKLLKFPLFESHCVPLHVLNAKGVYEAAFEDYYNPIVTCFESEVPGWFRITGKVQGALDARALLMGEFAGGSSLFGIRHSMALRSQVPEQALEGWDVLPVADVPF